MISPSVYFARIFPIECKVGGANLEKPGVNFAVTKIFFSVKMCSVKKILLFVAKNY